MIRLTRDERILIRRIARIQLQSLESLLSGNSSVDIQLKLATNNVSMEQWEAAVDDDIDTYQMIKRTPERAFDLLESDDYPVVDQIIDHFCSHRSYQKEVQSLRWKLLGNQRLIEHLN